MTILSRHQVKFRRKRRVSATAYLQSVIWSVRLDWLHSCATAMIMNLSRLDCDVSSLVHTHHIRPATRLQHDAIWSSSTGVEESRIVMVVAKVSTLKKQCCLMPDQKNIEENGVNVVNGFLSMGALWSNTYTIQVNILSTIDDMMLIDLWNFRMRWKDSTWPKNLKVSATRFSSTQNWILSIFDIFRNLWQSRRLGNGESINEQPRWNTDQSSTKRIVTKDASNVLALLGPSQLFQISFITWWRIIVRR